ncbi:MAG: hypothetical protein HQM10_18955 [Candidatus Riflebacteria bacterium]|nr:hypothetical protein [Candidatus Riflebacteria bacterium]
MDVKKTFQMSSGVIILAIIILFGSVSETFARNLSEKLIFSEDARLEGIGLSSAENASESRFSELFDDSLTDEERYLISIYLLPAEYGMLKRELKQTNWFFRKTKGIERAKDLFRAGYSSQGKDFFSRDFGDPDKMLEWAKIYKKDSEMIAFVASITRGDIIIMGPEEKIKRDAHVVCILTKGPFHHALVCIDDSPPVFIDAIGLVAARNDKTANCVRYTSWHEQISRDFRYRIIRPTMGLPPVEAADKVNKAIAYAVNQLGKPYDYAFSDNEQAFYCSELAYKAYSIGASMPDFLPQKSPERDAAIVAINTIVDGLGPKDKYDLSNRIGKFAKDYSQDSPPDVNKLFDFFVDVIATSCVSVEKVFPTDRSRKSLRGVLQKIADDKAFSEYKQAKANYNASKQAGKFDTGYGIGAAKEIVSESSIGLSLAKDIFALVSESEGNKFHIINLICRLIRPIYRNLGSYGELIAGVSSTSKASAGSGVQSILSMIEWVTEKREQVKKIPVAGPLLSELIPGANDGKIRTDFTSPTDLGNISSCIVSGFPK